MNTSRSLPALILATLTLFSMQAHGQVDYATTMDAAHQEAYARMKAGEPWAAAEGLLVALRELPADDPAVIDPAIAPGRLCVWIMSELLDDWTRMKFISDVMDMDQYPTDALVYYRYEIGYGTLPREKQSALWRKLEYDLANRGNVLARAGSLAILASPYYFPKWGSGKRGMRALVDEFSETELTASVLRVQLYWAKRFDEPLGKEIAATFNYRVLNRGDEYHPERIAIRDADPVLSQVLGVLHQLQNTSPVIQRDGVQALVQGLLATESPLERFDLLNVVSIYAQDGKEDLVRTACEDLAARNGATPDVLRARTILLNLEREAGNQERASELAEALINVDRIVDPVERSLHEEITNDLMHFGDERAKAGETDDAVSIFERIAAKYPGSWLAERCLKRAQAISDGRPEDNSPYQVP